MGHYAPFSPIFKENKMQQYIYYIVTGMDCDYNLIHDIFYDLRDAEYFVESFDNPQETFKIEKVTPNDD
jgi:hypothetical protein